MKIKMIDMNVGDGDAGIMMPDSHLMYLPDYVIYDADLVVSGSKVMLTCWRQHFEKHRKKLICRQIRLT